MTWCAGCLLVPKPARVDLIVGGITGPSADQSVFHAPLASVVRSWDVRERTGTFELVRRITVDGPFYVRIRGTDGERAASGTLRSVGGSASGE